MSIRKKILLGYGLALLVLAVKGALVYRSSDRLVHLGRETDRSNKALLQLETLLSLLKDMETGQRGFLLTGDAKYLEPYNAARDEVLPALQRLREGAAGDEAQRRRLDRLQKLIQEKLDELAETLEVRKKQGEKAALDIVKTDRGKGIMEQIRALAEEVREVEASAQARRRG